MLEPFVIETQSGQFWKFALDNRAIRSFSPDGSFGAVAFAYLYAASATYRYDIGLTVSFEDFCDKILPLDPAVMTWAGEVKNEMESFFQAFLAPKAKLKK